MERPCRYDRYEIVAAQLEGTGEFTVDVCENPAMFTAIVQRAGDGLGITVDVEVCHTHDLVLSTAPGWQRSLRIRSRPDAAATSPAADS